MFSKLLYHVSLGGGIAFLTNKMGQTVSWFQQTGLILTYILNKCFTS